MRQRLLSGKTPLVCLTVFRCLMMDVFGISDLRLDRCCDVSYKKVVLDAMLHMLIHTTPIHTVRPLPSWLIRSCHGTANLWKNDVYCLDFLDSKKPGAWSILNNDQDDK
jgi:hypothetical protein